MTYVKYLALLSTMALLFPLSVLAGDKTERSVNIPDTVQVGSTPLKPGNYKVEWQGNGPAVQVNFLQNGNMVATTPGRLKINDTQVKQDDLLIDTTSAHTKRLREIDFGHQKEALVLGQGGM